MDRGSTYARERDHDGRRAAVGRPRLDRAASRVDHLPDLFGSSGGGGPTEPAVPDDDPYDRIALVRGPLRVYVERQRALVVGVFGGDAEQRHEDATKLRRRHRHDGGVRRKPHGADFTIRERRRELAAELARYG